MGIAASVRAARRALEALEGDAASIEAAERLAGRLAAAFRAGQKVLICGNGGSACDAAHFAEELTGRFRAPRPGMPERAALPAIACTDAGHITCTANDMGFERVFARWVEALGRPGDVLILLSTSGNSANLVRAAEAGEARGMETAALLGRDGGKLRGMCRHEIIVPGEGSERIQELHMLLLHGMVEAVEEALVPRGV